MATRPECEEMTPLVGRVRPPGFALGGGSTCAALEREVSGTMTRVFPAEHLAAICVQVGRSPTQAGESRSAGAAARCRKLIGGLGSSIQVSGVQATAPCESRL